MGLDPRHLMTDKATSVLQVYLLGTVDFDAALLLQKRLLYDISGDRHQAALVICEHTPCITVGRQGSRAHILYEPEELRLRGWPVRWVNRGGGCILHHPGQLAIYPILPLDRLGLSVTEYLAKMGLAMGDLLADFDLAVGQDSNLPSTTAGWKPAPRSLGMYVGRRMLAAFGVAVRDWITYFGAYLNLQPPLELFRDIRTDLIHGEPMTSLERERRGPMRASLVRERLIEHWRDRFGFSSVALFSEHPFLEALQRRRQAQPAISPC